MSSEPTSSAAAAAAAAEADSDNLRRSKRKKFCLDVVAAAHGNNQKKSRKDPHADEEFNEDEYEDVGELEELSVITENGGDMSMMDVDDDMDESLTRRRSRRSTACFQNYQQDTTVVEMVGPYACSKCPSRYVSKSSLANHAKMHIGEKRKFACELCDFSSSTFKSLAHHHNVHKAFGVLSAPISPADQSESSTGEASSLGGEVPILSGEAPSLSEEAPPTNLNVSTDSTESTISLNGGAAPQLFVAAEEPFALENQGNEDEVDDEEDEMMPPILEREDDGPPVLLRQSRLETEENEDDEERESTPEPVRKSGRSAKPTQKKLAQKRPYGKKNGVMKPLILDTPISNAGSLPTSSASSVTPPDKRTPSPATSTESSRETTPKTIPKKTSKGQKKTKQLKKRKRCTRCPFLTSTASRLKRHAAGHQVKEGYICPIENCQFITRKAGFLPKHFILHSNTTLPWPPKYVKKIGRKIIEVPELNEHLGETERKKKKKEDEPKKKKKVMKEKIEETQENKQEQKKKKKRTDLIKQAQIRSYKTVNVDGVAHKKCNVEDCDFQTVSLTQLVVHKTKVHRAQSMFPLHPFLCFTCGVRTKTYAALRTHKLTNHISAGRRFHRTYYLKEIIGDKFFVQHFLNIPATPAPPPEPVAKVDKEDEEDPSGDESFDAIQPADVTSEAVLALMEGDPNKPVIFCCNLCPYKAPISSRLQRHFDKHFTSDTYKCQYCGWSSRNKEVLVTHEKLHLPEKVEENEEVKMEETEAKVEQDQEEVKVEEVTATTESPKTVSSSRSASGEPDNMSKTSSSSNMDTTTSSEAQTSSESSSENVISSVETSEGHPVLNSIQKWCTEEKQRRPDIDDQFTRKMIDGIKGFQCSDCPYTSKYRGDMRSHKKRHDIEQMYRCVQCTYTTNRPVSLKDHLKQHVIVNNSLETVKERKVIVNQGVPIGIRRGTGKDRVYCCGKCPYTTLAIGCLWRHFRNHRTTARINICSNCSYSSIDQRKMEEHTIIHLAMGVNEPMPFVKRVDQNGRPVSSLTDLNVVGGSAAERKANKRKMGSEEPVSEDSQKRSAKMAKTALTPKPVKPEKPAKATRAAKGAITENTPSTENSSPEKSRRRLSMEQSPEDSDYSMPGPSSQPTRTLSDRATRNRSNYSNVTKNGSGRPTPQGSSAHLDKLHQQSKAPRESLEVSHHRIRSYLNQNFGLYCPTQCEDCPYKSSDPLCMEQHRLFHEPINPPRPQQCTDCSFSTYTPASLLQHVKLHGDVPAVDPFQKRMHTKNRKGDYIPPGVKGYYCKNCSFKCASRRGYEDHLAQHRGHLISRLIIQLKRQPPKPEYKRPKHKHLFVAKNAKYCKKCTFKCASHSAYIEHLDRHGWNQLYKCYICDYSDNNKSVVDYHQLTHHIVRDQTLHGINQASDYRLEDGKILKPEFQMTQKEKPTPEQFVQKSRSLLKCASCEHYCHVSSELAHHMSNNHMDVPNAKETISYLHMGLVPPNASVTTVL